MERADVAELELLEARCSWKFETWRPMAKVVSVTAFLFKSEPRLSAMHLLAPATAVSGGVLCDLEGFGRLELF
jgi:hypothetical protein